MLFCAKIEFRFSWEIDLGIREALKPSFSRGCCNDTQQGVATSISVKCAKKTALRYPQTLPIFLRRDTFIQFHHEEYRSNPFLGRIGIRLCSCLHQQFSRICCCPRNQGRPPGSCQGTQPNCWILGSLEPCRGWILGYHKRRNDRLLASFRNQVRIVFCVM